MRTGNLAEAILNSPASAGDTAIFFEGGSTTHGHLRKKINSLAASLRRAGVGPGVHVALVFPNVPDFVFSYFAVLAAGGVVVPVNPLFKPYEMKYILSHSDARLVLYSRFFENTVKKSVSKEVLLADELVLSQWMEKDEEFTPTPREKNDLAVIMYTSGTTGRPKGAMLSHGNLLADSEAVIEGLKLEREDVMLTVLPLFHSFGAMVGMISPLRRGARTALVPRFTPEAVIKAIKQYGATVFPAVPPMFALLNRVKDISRQDLPSLKYCISGGAPLPLEVMEEFERKFGVPIYEGDGPTECSPVTSVNPIGGKRKPGSIGLPVKNVEMEIADEEGNFLPPGQIGEIVVRGPNVFLGYYKDPQATKEAFFGDWFRTGDLGKKDEEGYFYIVDRKKDMIIVDGLNVYPREVEELLYRFPQVAEAAVVGKPHPLHGEIPVAFVSLKDRSGWDEARVRKYLRKHLAQYKIPRQFYILDSLPKTPTGKISKVELRRRLENNL